MFLPKFAAHATPFKLSHLATRSHQHFQQIRHSLNLNLGGAGSSSSASASGSGLGAAASSSGSGAAGAGGAKWQAGNRAGGWAYQTHGRLVNQLQGSSSDVSGRTQDDDDRPSAQTHFLRSLRLQRQREREEAFARRWGSEHAVAQERRRSSSTSARHAQSSTLTEVESLRDCFKAKQQHEADASSPSSRESRGRLRRSASTSSLYSVATRPSRRRSASVGDVALLDSAVFTGTQLRGLSTDSTLPSATQLNESQDFLHSSDTGHKRADSDWLEEVEKLSRSNSFREAKRFFSRLPVDAPIDAVEQTMWFYATSRHNLAPVRPIEFRYHRLLERRVQPSIHMHDILIWSLSQREVEQQAEERRAKFHEVEKTTRQRVGREEFIPIEYVKGELDQYLQAAVAYYADLGPKSARLQPATFEMLLIAAGSIKLRSPEKQKALVSMAISVFSHLESSLSYTPQSYAALINLFGNAADLVGAREVWEDYMANRHNGKITVLNHNLKDRLGRDAPPMQPDLQTFEDGDAKVLSAFIKACFRSRDPKAAVAAFDRCLTEGRSAGVCLRNSHIADIILGFCESGDDASATRWLERVKAKEAPLAEVPTIDWFLRVARSATNAGCMSIAVDAFLGAIAVPVEQSKLKGMLVAVDVFPVLVDFLLVRIIFDKKDSQVALRSLRSLFGIFTQLNLERSETAWTAASVATHADGLAQVSSCVQALVKAGKVEALEAILRHAKARHSSETFDFLYNASMGISDGGRRHPALPPLAWASRITQMWIPRPIKADLARQICKMHLSERNTGKKAVWDWKDADWGLLLEAAAIVHLLQHNGQSSLVNPTWHAGLLLAEFGSAIDHEPSVKTDFLRDANVEFITSGLSTAVTPDTPENVLKVLGVGDSLREQLGNETVEMYLEQEKAFNTNRYNALRLQGMDNANAVSDQAEPELSRFSPVTETHDTPPTSPASSDILADPNTVPALDAINVPHPPFIHINDNLSAAALRSHCSRDVRHVATLWDNIRSSTKTGSYISTEAGSALIETMGRLNRPEWVREAYVYAHVALSAVTMSYERRNVVWVKLEDRMIIAMAYCGALDEVAIHRSRLIEAGEAPSADAYAAMIQHAHETTDDASVALAYFEEANRLRVVPNTFLCNTIIAKLSRARRASAALEIYDYMKQHNLVRNSVTYGAIINACCRTGDDATAESLFAEMLVSPNYKARIPPFNTMIQFFVNTLPKREKALYYYDALLKQGVPPTEHTYNMLMQAYGFIEPTDLNSMNDVFGRACQDQSVTVNGSHWSTLINAQGCIKKDLDGAIALFDSISSHPTTQRSGLQLPDAVCYESLFNVFLSLHRPDLIPAYVEQMRVAGVHMTAYVVNTLIKGHALAGDIVPARSVFEGLRDPPPGYAASFNHPAPSKGRSSGGNTSAGPPIDVVYREPSCYETMIRAELGFGETGRAEELVSRMEARAYPVALINRVRRLINPPDASESATRCLEPAPHLPWVVKQPTISTAAFDTSVASDVVATRT